ncbi:D-inositol-3-phosphate glycosyltransferase [Stieleria maiorica]|uniref:D-inositol-3-phosphate glycosyltransferase n=1 Tax=Stieleria maiorica TaxID=2795974 RepID=A0A5B9MQ26_9BACT|nr:glycosyltransferase family 4 protein [Stieleria maiorica]QEG01048.1 D-inositol-3-phosphate glycosyltransferase [Stieleria maiorica]
MRSVKLINDGARLQQRSFTPLAKRAILKFQPEYVWLQEGTLARSLQRWIRRNRIPTRLVFCDGAPVGAEFSSEFDFVVNLTPTAREELISHGYPESRTRLIPHPVTIPAPTKDRATWRQSLGFRESDRLVISVAAWNSHHKRIDYVIREMAAVRRDHEQYKLLLCGQPTPETPGLQKLARELLGDNVRWMTLPLAELSNAYHAADLFVLASHNEALGAVIAEAAIAGLPIICNDFPAARYILGDHPGIVDLRHDGALAEAIGGGTAIRGASGVTERVKSQFCPRRLACELAEFLEGVDA